VEHKDKTLVNNDQSTAGSKTIITIPIHSMYIELMTCKTCSIEICLYMSKRKSYLRTGHLTTENYFG